MKKKTTIFLSLLCILSLLSGCSQKSENRELDDLISNLPSVQDPFSTDNPSQNGEEDSISYISVSGKIASLSKDSITVKIDGKEQKYYFDDSTNIFGGDISEGEYVTVTYNEADKSEKKIVAFAITVLNGEVEANVTDEETAVTANSPSETTDEAVEGTSEQTEEANDSTITTASADTSHVESEDTEDSQTDPENTENENNEQIDTITLETD